jgi:hypothetical protein
MSTSVTLHGVSYEIPERGEVKSTGNQLSRYLVALGKSHEALAQVTGRKDAKFVAQAPRPLRSRWTISMRY